MKKPNKKKTDDNNTAVVNAATNALKNEGRGEILSDILGSYTGMAADGDAPVQDADDL